MKKETRKQETNESKNSKKEDNYLRKTKPWN